MDTSTSLSTGSFQYTDNKLDFFPHTSTALSAGAEGYVKATPAGLGGGTSYAFNYVFSYTDHLGNIRLRYAQDPSNNNEVAILEEDHYYPYGLKHNGYSTGHIILTKDDGPGTGVVLTPVNPFLGDSYKYKFGGKEYQDEFDINTYDFGARNYDPALGRWMNIDPLAELSRKFSPYTYALDNPIYFIDPDGMFALSSGSGLGISDSFQDFGAGNESGDWKDNGDGTYTAEKGDSAATLSKDAGVSFEEADAAVQDQLGENYVEDGVEKSNVEEGDIVDLSPDSPDPVIGKEMNSGSFPINVPEDMNNDGKLDAVSIDTDGDGFADSYLPSDPRANLPSNSVGTVSLVVQQIVSKAVGTTAGQLVKSQSLNGNEATHLENKSLGLPANAPQRSRDSVRLVQTGIQYHNGKN